MASLAVTRIVRLVFAGLFTVVQAATYVALCIPIGSIVGFVAGAVYEPLSGRRVDHLRAAGYGGLLMGWFALVLFGFLVVFPLD
jgi:hypothetical protein